MHLQGVLYPLIRRAMFALDAERAHRLMIAALKALPAGKPAPRDAMLAIRLAGLDFPNPVGLAAGFDKDAEVFAAMLRFGFGSVEVGTLTPVPQAGNPRPRLFRLVEDRAVINRMGFNNRGIESAAHRLSARRPGLVGVNVGANKDSADRIGDYVTGVRRLGRVADYLTINISSPNTPGLRALQDQGALRELLAAIGDARQEETPIFLKVSPDLDARDVDAIARTAIDAGMDALIVANTTVSRPPALRSRHSGEGGGLSGAPLKALALQRVRDFRSATGGALPLIATGGIENGTDAYARIAAGASLVQLYSALVFEGPGLVRRIARELRALLARDGFGSLEQAVGSGARA